MTIPVIKPQRIRRLCSVDIAAMKNLVARISDHVWNAENEGKENNFDCFHHTRHIVFRFIENNRDHRNFYSNPVWTVWQNHLLPVLDQAGEPFKFNEPVYPKVMLARLAAGATIDRHTDGEGSHIFTHKIHIPIETNEQTRMFVRDRYFHLQEGQAYEVNNIVPHSVENLGSTDRIHLIFEIFDRSAQKVK